jgi:hypothetical protein
MRTLLRKLFIACWLAVNWHISRAFKGATKVPFHVSFPTTFLSPRSPVTSVRQAAVQRTAFLLKMSEETSEAADKKLDHPARNTSSEAVGSKAIKANIFGSETFRTIIAASLTAFTTATISRYMKALVPLMNNHQLTTSHWGPIVAGILVSLLYWTRKDFGTDMSSILSLGQYSLTRQILRIASAVIGIGLGFPLAIAGPAVEMGMTAGRVFAGGEDFEVLKNCIAAGVCAGFTTMFDAPIAGIVYFLEVTRPMIKKSGRNTEHLLTSTSILDDNLMLGSLLLGSAIASKLVVTDDFPLLIIRRSDS